MLERYVNFFLKRKIVTIHIAMELSERLVAERHLSAGTFLIREREADQLEYALTIRDMDHGHGPCVKHYKIRKLDNEQGYYITTRVVFPSLEALVNYYSGSCFLSFKIYEANMTFAFLLLAFWFF